MAIQRGLDQRHEQNPQLLLRDTRTLGQRIVGFYHDPNSVAVLIVILATLAFFIPGIVDVIVLFGIGSFIFAYTRRVSLPFRLPQRSYMLDYNDPLPGSNKPRKARGIAFFGNDKTTNQELWFNNDDMRTHALIFGSTGSGKTEALVSLAFNSLIQGSGFIYVDGKGDNALFAKIFSMVRRMGREDDLLLINFMTGARDIVGPQEKRLSNTMNPFANGSSSMLAQLVVSMMDSGGASPDGDMWKGRAINFVEALMKIMVYMRDQGHILLDVNVIRNYFELTRLEAIVVDKQFIRDNQEPVSLVSAPEVVIEPLKNYVVNLPGYDRSRKGKQVSQVLEQHGFITMQLVRVFSSLADTYGHILRTNLAEVDLKDVVLNRRILVVLLPALEKSPDELSNLGKIIIASLKAMMAAGLGDEVEGEYRDVIQRKPTNAPTPYLAILDEYGYYAVKGFAVVPAQARSLGFSAIFAGQDLPAFEKASKEEAASIGANTNIKICMKLEDPMQTWDFFSKTAGESYVTKVDSFQTKAENLTNTYLDSRSASTDKWARINLLDLKDQREGEAHIFFKSKIVRAKMFYADPPPVARMRLNHFLRVEPPKSKMLAELDRQMVNFQKVFEQGTILANLQTATESEEIAAILKELEQNVALEPIERSVAALIAFHNRGSEVTETEVEEEDNDLSHMHIFAKMRILESDRRYFKMKNLEQFSKPLLNKKGVCDQATFAERITGKFEKHLGDVIVELLKDMETATFYPPEITIQPDIINLTQLVQQLSSNIVSLRQIGSAETKVET